MARQLLVFGEKTFKISIPDDAKVTFGPFSPPRGDTPDWRNSGKAVGTLRIYVGTEKNIIGLFTGVTSFRDLSMDYAEEVAKEEGATIWKSDDRGYEYEEKRTKTKEWIEPAVSLPAGNGKRRAKP